LRIGLGLAKGLALAHDLLLVGVPTFEVLMRAQPPRDERVIAVLHAGRGRISAADFVWHAKSGWAQRGEIRIRDWASLADEIAEPTYLCGEMDAAGIAILHKLRHRVTLASPAQSLRRAGYLAEIGWERLRASPAAVDDPGTLAPIYGGRPEGAPA
jgi:tRNA threonylcarbamoyladenosine biosynthesis protein TsaB